jgi:apolipoprotein D and lipocalin family protein
MTPNRIYARGVILATLTVLLFAGTTACHGPQPERTPLATVQHVDLERYLGRWYEIAKIPNRFQSQCVSDTTANYARNADGSIEVVNRCRTREGDFDEARAIARVVDPRTNAKLEVSFFSLLGWRPVWGDYWVLALGPNYEYAVVGEPSRRYGWILARTPSLPAATRDVINQRLQALGYLTETFKNSPHAADH